jgi:hypothetical protein
MNKIIGIKHLIECHCTLKIYVRKEKQLYHKFSVYTKFDSNGKPIEKISQCNNCGTLHNVYDICKSQIIKGGKDTNSSSLTKEDMSIQLPEKVSRVLEKYQCDIATWEHVLDIYENNLWDSHVVISREVINEEYHVKYLTILQDDKIKIKNTVINNSIGVI